MSTIIVCGRLGKDAELKTTSKGTKIAAFSVADDIGYGDKKRTQWLKCSMFGERAEKVVSYLTKGLMVEVVGTPQVETWTKDGEARGSISITVSDVKFHGGGQKDRPVADNARATSRDDMNDDVPW